jgi:hypothetical protein
MPGSSIAPAPPRRSAHRDQAVAATTPTDTRVSIVEEPWRAARKAARWNGNAAHVTTGRVRAATTHCHPGKWSAEIIERATTGTASVPATTSRRRR